MRFLSKVLSIAVLILLGVGNSWAAERVVTVYFCGTGLTSEAYDPAVSPWHSPELIAELYQNDSSQPIIKKDYIIGNLVYEISTLSGQSHYKYIAEGLGTDAFSWAGGVDPDFGIRGWDAVEDEAFSAVNLIAENHPADNIVLNLIGFSRGGILAMKVARRVADYAPVASVNILAYDPVPGGFDPIGRFGNDLKLPPKVHQYIGVYARDELTTIFEPVIPDVSDLPSSSKTWMINIPGGHETMVGNFQIDGHNKPPLELPPDYSSESGQMPVNKVARVIAEQLLTSAPWGEVTFSSMAPENNEANFEQLVSDMYLYDYWFVRATTFLPGFTGFDLCYAATGRDHHLRFTSLIPVTGEKKRLCFVAPERHTPEWAWSCLPWPVWFPSAEKVFWLMDRTQKLQGDNAWQQLAFLRGESDIDDTIPPVPVVAELPVTSGSCFVSVESAPVAYDNVSGTITGVTTDPRLYTEQGTFTINWTYTDANGNSTTQTQLVEVLDETPPIPDSDNHDTEDIVEGLSAIEGECSAEISTFPTATDDCSGIIDGYTYDPLNYSAQGIYEVRWIYEDGNGNTSEQFQDVIIKDVTPPEVTRIVSSPEVLWPPNHKMSTVVLDVTVKDNCAEAPSCQITTVSSNEPDNNSGDSNTSPDWQITGKDTVKLRAERSGSGSDRVYTISVECVDTVGNSAQGSVVVTVPHDKGKGK